MHGSPVVDIDHFRLLNLAETACTTQLVHHYLVRLLSTHSMYNFKIKHFQISHFGDIDALQFPTKYDVHSSLYYALNIDRMQDDSYRFCHY